MTSECRLGLNPAIPEFSSEPAAQLSELLGLRKTEVMRGVDQRKIIPLFFGERAQQGMRMRRSGHRLEC